MNFEPARQRDVVEKMMEKKGPSSYAKVYDFDPQSHSAQELKLRRWANLDTQTANEIHYFVYLGYQILFQDMTGLEVALQKMKNSVEEDIVFKMSKKYEETLTGFNDEDQSNQIDNSVFPFYMTVMSNLDLCTMSSKSRKNPQKESMRYQYVNKDSAEIKITNRTQMKKNIGLLFRKIAKDIDNTRKAFSEKVQNGGRTKKVVGSYILKMILRETIIPDDYLVTIL